VKVHPFIEAEKVAGDSVDRTCRLLEVLPLRLLRTKNFIVEALRRRRHLDR
jgi:hypothetical protein